MMMGTHLVISNNIIESLDNEYKKYINENNFKYGNIKPDIFSKYKLKKHYFDESYNMIEEKIQSLSSMTPDQLERTFTSVSFNQELGVICHFLCDFFCIAHSERWEFKHSFKQHVSYEMDLNRRSKEFRFNLDKHKIEDDFNKFFSDLYREYKATDKSQRTDLVFSSYVSKSVIKYIMDNIFKKNNTPNFTLSPAY